ncbi:MAG: hypothetical protein EOP20_13735, partial [Hyphomicrobiales bacterium]
MPRALALMRAIVGPEGSEALAKQLFEEAMLTEVDPLVHVAFSLNLDISTVLQRGADLAGLAFFDVIPVCRDVEVPLRIDRLADIHVVRVSTIDRDIAYTAPDFHQLMKLWTLRDEDPAIASRVCIVPAAAMRQYLAGVAAPGLLDAARQNLVRYWPSAAASLELTFASRLAFAALVLVLVALLFATPYLAAGWIMPAWATLVLLPALVRLGAMFMPLRATPPVTRAEPADLPIYSVLVPLRDEAEMVDQLCRG